jgi:hypothetical protein
MTHLRMSNAAVKLSPCFGSVLVAVRAAIEGMSDEQMAWHPEGKWSASEILEHLSLTYSRTAERIKPLLAENSPDVRHRNFKEWLGGITVLKLGKIPSGRKSPEAQVPKGMSPVEVRTYIEEQLFQLDQTLDQCEKRFGSKTRILVHHVLGPLSTSGYRRFHCVHTTHHMKQVRALRQKMKAVGIA